MTEISYPVFSIGTEKPVSIDQVLIYLRQYEDKEGNFTTSALILDDKSMSGKTLGERRLALLKEGVKLKPIGKAVFFLGDLIKLATRKMWFIDNAGNLFQYKKIKRAVLLFRKIVLQISIPSGGSILEVEGIPNRFKTLYTIQPEEKYAGVLMSGMKYILYGVYTYMPEKPTWRMF